MSAATWSKEYELLDGLRFVDRLDVPHRIAYERRFDVFIRRAGGGRARHLFNDATRSLACPLVFSPDGSTIYHSYDQIVAIDVRTGRVRAVTSFEGEERFGVTWDLHLSPDGTTLFFKHHPHLFTNGPGRSRICAIGTDGTNFRVVYEPTEHAGLLWRFSCDFDRGAIRAVVTSKGPKKIFFMDLEGRDVRPQTERRLLGTPSPRADLLDLPDDTGVYVPREQARTADLPSHGRAPKLSPDRAAVAFMREDHAIWVAELGANEARCIARAREGSQQPDDGSWAVEPVWSPDGRLLWFRSTTGRRASRPRHPEYVEQMRKTYGEASDRFARVLEQAHWSRQFRVGIVDWTDKVVWMAKAAWWDVAIAP